MAFTQVRGHADPGSGLDRCRVSMHRVRRARTLRRAAGRQSRAAAGRSTRERRPRPPVPEAAARTARRRRRAPCPGSSDARPAGTLGAVTRPTPRAPQLVVRRRTSVLTAGLAVAGALALSGCQLDVPAADDGALPAGRRRERHPGRGQGQRPRDHLERQGPAGRPVGADRQQRRPAGDRHHLRAGGARGHQAGRAPAPWPACRESPGPAPQRCRRCRSSRAP